MNTQQKPPVPNHLEGLVEMIEGLIDSVADQDATIGRESDGYGKCVEAMWRAAYMAHELVASRLGVTGFQHGMSSLRLLGALRSLEGPYMIVDASRALYPQYDLVGKVQNFLAGQDVRSWLAREATKKPAAARGHVHRLVRADDAEAKVERQRDRLRARERQVRRLRAEVTRLHALVADLRATASPAWDEEAVVEGMARAVYPFLFTDDRQPLRVFGEAHSDAELREGERDVARERMRQALAVVRDHLPVKPSREAVIEAMSAALHVTTDRIPGLNPSPVLSADCASVVAAAEAELDACAHNRAIDAHTD